MCYSVVHLRLPLQFTAAWPIVTCQKCSSRTCFTHDTIWHEGKTCGEYTKELEEKTKAGPARELESKKSEIWMKKHAKICPGKGCGRPVCLFI
jgi:hypothetical protein